MTGWIGPKEAGAGTRDLLVPAAAAVAWAYSAHAAPAAVTRRGPIRVRLPHRHASGDRRLQWQLARSWIVMLIQERPVLYLDLDDTLLTWSTSRPAAAPGAREFVLWALEHYEVRWLTRWCPSGEMSDEHIHDLGRLLGIPPEDLRPIRGCEWDETGSKLNGIAWLEHVILERPFVWLEDEKGVGPRELSFLSDHLLIDSYHPVNVTEDPGSLSRAHVALRERLGSISGEYASLKRGSG